MAKPKPVPLADVVAKLAEEHGCPQAEAKRMLASVQSVVRQLVTDGHAVRLPDLATGEVRTVPATRQVRVAVAGPFKTTVKGAAAG